MGDHLQFHLTMEFQLTCQECGAPFVSKRSQAKYCVECRERINNSRHSSGHVRMDLLERKKMSYSRAKDRRERDERLAKRDAEYAKLGVPVTVTVDARGIVTEHRGQGRGGSRLGAFVQSQSGNFARRWL